MRRLFDRHSRLRNATLSHLPSDVSLSGLRLVPKPLRLDTPVQSEVLSVGEGRGEVDVVPYGETLVLNGEVSDFLCHACQERNLIAAAAKEGDGVVTDSPIKQPQSIRVMDALSIRADRFEREIFVSPKAGSTSILPVLAAVLKGGVQIAVPSWLFLTLFLMALSSIAAVAGAVLQKWNFKPIVSDVFFLSNFGFLFAAAIMVLVGFVYTWWGRSLPRSREWMYVVVWPDDPPGGSPSSRVDS